MKTFFILLVLSLFPGSLFFSFLRVSLGIKQAIVSIPFLSHSFWIVLIWFTSLLHISYSKTVFFLIVLFFTLLLFEKRRVLFQLKSVSLLKGKRPGFPEMILFTVMALYFLPVFFIYVPRGADMSMHGYITCLILNNDNIPSSYEPVLPVDNFGSYSAGFHSIAAAMSSGGAGEFALSLTMLSVFSYQLCLLGVIFILARFIHWRSAVLAGVFSMALSRVPQDSFAWGGNPTVLSQAFCFYAAGFVYVRIADRVL